MVCGLQDRLAKFENWFRPLERSLDELDGRLRSHSGLILSHHRVQIQLAESVLARIEPTKLLSELNAKIGVCSTRLESGVRMNLTRMGSELIRLEDLLNVMNPRNVLQRGYALVEIGGSVLTSVANVQPGDDLRVSLSDGSLEVQANRVIPR
jgi:exodeoxyribonuclease VII large subunit